MAVFNLLQICLYSCPGLKKLINAHIKNCGKFLTRGINVLLSGSQSNKMTNMRFGSSKSFFNI